MRFCIDLGKWILILIFFCIGVAFLFSAYNMVDVEEVQSDEPVTVTGIVTRFSYETVRNPDDSYSSFYNLYITYTREGKQHQTVYDTVDTQTEAQSFIGKTVQMQIEQDIPVNKPYLTLEFFEVCLFGVVFTYVAVSAGIRNVRNRKRVAKINR